MGIVNAQRTLNYIRTLTEFFSQPEYVNVVPMFSIINEPLVTVIGAAQIRAFYLEAYRIVRAASGIGGGPMISIHDGFGGQGPWVGFLYALSSGSMID